MAIFRKENRINVYQDTIECIKAGMVTGSTSKTPYELGLQKTLSGTRFYQKVKKTDENYEWQDTVMYAQVIDCIQKAYEFGEDGALLNMASRFRAGGGVVNGSASQEEEIFRRTTLGYSLYFLDPGAQVEYEYPGKHPKIPGYPFKGDRAAIWSPDVVIFKKGPNGYYDYMGTPGITNVITIPAVQHPELTENGTEFKEKPARMWRNKIRSLLRVAKEHGKKKLVLGAFGCGAYGNPPELVARYFKEIFNEPEFKGYFTEVCFAILEDKNSPKDGNYAPFAKVFGHK